MNDKFKLSLLEKLEATRESLDQLLKVQGSVTDICEVDGEILEMATGLHDLIQRYSEYLVRPESKPVRFVPRGLVGNPRGLAAYGRRPVIRYSEDGE